jgi:hypothetical protein
MPEKDIPIPHPYATRQHYAWGKMEVGDCLTFHNRDLNSINVMAWRAAKRLGIKVTVRKCEGCIRVWRSA